MLVAGLTGGLASGKSHVGQCLAELGCLLVKADELGHVVLMPGGEAYDAAVREFGTGILDPGGTIDRRRLAALVFDCPGRLEKLNSLVHPPVRERTRSLLHAFRLANPDGIAVIEAAILIETGSNENYDCLIVAACTEEQQIERALERGLTREEVLARLRRQLPLSKKIEYADYVIDTSGTREDTAARTRVVYDAMRSTQK